MTNIAHHLYEQTLVLRSQIGDDAAFAELMRIYSPRIRVYVEKMLQRQPEMTDDILQDVWVSAFRSLGKLQDIAAFQAWVYRIARDRVFREFRRRHIEWSLLDESIDAISAAEDVTESLDIETIRQHLEKISAQHREVLVLRFLEELSYEEIAHVTGNSVGTVRSRIHYGKRALRRAFEDKTYERK